MKPSATAFLVIVAAALVCACADDRRPRGRGDAGTPPADAGSGEAGFPDGMTPPRDGMVPYEDAGPGLDGGPRVDGGMVTQGTCDPACLAMAGAVCCTACGCSGSVRCTPVCSAGFMWDCEIGCCFSYSTYECDCPTGTSWDGTAYCCKDSSDRCLAS